MGKKRGLILVLSLILIFVFFFQAVSADLIKGNNSYIEKTYSPEDNLRGMLNISLKNELSNSTISSNFQSSIKLIDFLERNLADYNCVPENCGDSYKAVNGEETKSFSVNKDKILALVLNGIIDEISGLSFNVSFSNNPVCSTPLEIDILNDDSIEWRSEKTTEIFDCGSIGKGEPGKGCYKEENVEEVRVGSNIYCEKISFLRNKKFKLGAWVRGSDSTTWQNGLLVMELYDLDGEKLKSCNLPQPSITGGEISCNVEFQNNEEEDYYVCIKVTGNTYYKIKREGKDVCGFYGNPGSFPGFSYDYSVFAKSAKFDSIGNFIFNQELFQENEGSLAEYIDNYLDNEYDKNCTNKCIIPINFSIKTASTLNVFNVKLDYSKDGSPEEENKIYDTSKEAPKINSEFLPLDLSLANFKVPAKYGNYTAKIYLANGQILSEQIRVENVPVIKWVAPDIVPAAVPTKFIVNVSVPSGRSITSYTWDFGDETTEETNVNYASHIYSDIGEYDLIIEIEDNLGYKSSKTFSIEVISPKDSVNSTIINYKKRLSDITKQVALMPSWYKSFVENAIDFLELNDELKNFEQKYNSASDEEYVEIMGNLTEMRVPKAVKEGLIEELPLLIAQEDIELEKLERLGAGSYDENEEAYKEAIAAWSQENLGIQLEFKYISVYYDDETENPFVVYKLKIASKEEVDENSYVIINDENVKFSGDYNKKDLENAVGLIFSDTRSRDIEFLSAIGIENLVIYLSPDFSKLELEARIEPCNFNYECEKELGENWRNCRQDCKPWGWAGFLIAVVIVFALIIYILLQWWYKEKYESFLFKNRNDLYNLMNFISNAKSQGLSDSEIAGRLKKSGWNGEQVSYAFKKFKGKAIMPFDFLKLFKKFERK